MIDRRRFLVASGAGIALGLLPSRPRSARAALSEHHLAALRTSPYVYVSPLKSDGSESRCHAEVWYGWLDAAVVLTVSSDGWKARAVARGLDRARVWVGDYGSVGRLGGDGFRKGPSFVARVEARKDDALLERLLAEYDRKYPAEIGKWRDRMRSGHADGSRVLLRYRPEPA